MGGITCSSSLLQTLATDDTMSLVPGHCVKRSFMVIPIRSIIILITYKLSCIGTFLSDASPIIGYACHSLTNSLTHSCLVNLIDVTLACEDANSKLVEVVTVDDIDAEDHVGNSLLQIWKLTFGPKAKLLFRL